jgi:TPR repeat protein
MRTISLYVLLSFGFSAHTANPVESAASAGAERAVSTASAVERKAAPSPEARSLAQLADTFAPYPGLGAKDYDAAKKLFDQLAEAVASGSPTADLQAADTPDAVSTGKPDNAKLKAFCNTHSAERKRLLRLFSASLAFGDMALRCADFGASTDASAAEAHVAALLQAYRHFPGDRPWLARPVMFHEDVQAFLRLGERELFGSRYLRQNALIMQLYLKSQDGEFSSQYFDMTPLIVSQIALEPALHRSSALRKDVYSQALGAWNNDPGASYWSAMQLTDPGKRLAALTKVAESRNHFAELSVADLCVVMRALNCADTGFEAVLTMVEAAPQDTEALLKLAKFYVIGKGVAADTAAALTLLDRAKTAAKATAGGGERGADRADFLEFEFALSNGMPEAVLRAQAKLGRMGFVWAQLVKNLAGKDEAPTLLAQIATRYPINAPARLRLLPPTLLDRLISDSAKRAFKLTEAPFGTEFASLTKLAAEQNRSASLRLLASRYEAGFSMPEGLTLAPETLRERAAAAGDGLSSWLLTEPFAAKTSAAELKYRKIWLNDAFHNGAPEALIELSELRLAALPAAQQRQLRLKMEDLIRTSEFEGMVEPYVDSALTPKSPYYNPEMAQQVLKRAIRAKAGWAFVRMAQAESRGELGRKADMRAAHKWLEQGDRLKLDRVTEQLATRLWRGQLGVQDRPRARALWQRLAQQGDLFAINNLAWSQCTVQNPDKALAAEGSAALANEVAQMERNAGPNVVFYAVLLGTSAACFAAEGKFEKALEYQHRADQIFAHTAYLDRDELPLNALRRQRYAANQSYFEAEYERF